MEGSADLVFNQFKSTDNLASEVCYYQYRTRCFPGIHNHISTGLTWLIKMIVFPVLKHSYQYGILDKPLINVYVVLKVLD